MKTVSELQLRDLIHSNEYQQIVVVYEHMQPIAERYLIYVVLSGNNKNEELDVRVLFTQKNDVRTFKSLDSVFKIFHKDALPVFTVEEYIYFTSRLGLTTVIRYA